MLVETKKELISINRITDEKKMNFTVEGDIIIPDSKPDIVNSIHTSGIVTLQKREALDGRVRIDGEVNIYSIYLSEIQDDMIRSVNSSLNFNEIVNMENVSEGMNLDCNIRILNIETRILNGRKINVRANLECNMKGYSNEDIEVIKECDNAIDMRLLNKRYKVNSLIGNGNTKIQINENLRINDTENLIEVMKCDFDIVNKEIRTSYNKVLAKLEGKVKIMYLTENGKINVINSKIPLMGFIDIDNVTEDCECDLRYNLKTFSVRENGTDDRNLNIEGELELQCVANETKDIEIMQDLYSPIKDINYDSRKIKTILNKKIVTGKAEIREEQVIPGLDENAIYDVDSSPKITNRVIMDGKIIYDGEVEIKILHQDINGMGMKNLTLPFEMVINNDSILQDDVALDEVLEISLQDITNVSNDTIDIMIDLDMLARILNMDELEIIENIEMNDEYEDTMPSLILYIVKAGDTLWKIAKKYKSTIDDIVKINEIDEPDKLQIGEKLFIPKYTKMINAI